jgi:hypothetical protein
MYPTKVNFLCYTLGLIGEYHEFLQKTEDYNYNFLNYGEPQPTKSIEAEGGDVFWYIEAIMQLFGKTIDDINFLKTFPPNYNPYIITNVKKIPRDNTTLSKYKTDIIEAVTWFAIKTMNTANGYGVTLDDMLLNNYSKLISRAERGTIVGDGDNR